MIPLPETPCPWCAEEHGPVRCSRHKLALVRGMLTSLHMQLRDLNKGQPAMDRERTIAELRFLAPEVARVLDVTADDPPAAERSRCSWCHQMHGPAPCDRQKLANARSCLESLIDLLRNLSSSARPADQDVAQETLPHAMIEIAVVLSETADGPSPEDASPKPSPGPRPYVVGQGPEDANRQTLALETIAQELVRLRRLGALVLPLLVGVSTTHNPDRKAAQRLLDDVRTSLDDIEGR